MPNGEKVAELYSERNASRICVDAIGVGAGVGPQAARNLRAKGIKLALGAVTRVTVAAAPTKQSEHGQFALLRDHLLWALREWLREEPGAMLPPDDELREELLALTYESDQKGRIQITRKATLRDQLERSPNRADALALTVMPKGKKEVKLAFV